MPFMTDGSGADWIGGWFGTGPERGIALMFTLAGLIGVVVTHSRGCRARTAGCRAVDSSVTATTTSDVGDTISAGLDERTSG